MISQSCLKTFWWISWISQNCIKIFRDILVDFLDFSKLFQNISRYFGGSPLRSFLVATQLVIMDRERGREASAWISFIFLQLTFSSLLLVWSVHYRCFKHPEIHLHFLLSNAMLCIEKLQCISEFKCVLQQDLSICSPIENSLCFWSRERKEVVVMSGHGSLQCYNE